MVSGTARRLAAAFLLGAAVGAAATVPYYGRRVEALLLTTGSLLQQLHEHRARLARLDAGPVLRRLGRMGSSCPGCPGQQRRDEKRAHHPPLRRENSPRPGSYIITAPAKNTAKQPATTASAVQLT